MPDDGWRNFLPKWVKCTPEAPRQVIRSRPTHLDLRVAGAVRGWRRRRVCVGLSHLELEHLAGDPGLRVREQRLRWVVLSLHHRHLGAGCGRQSGRDERRMVLRTSWCGNERSSGASGVTSALNGETTLGWVDRVVGRRIVLGQSLLKVAGWLVSRDV